MHETTDEGVQENLLAAARLVAKAEAEVYAIAAPDARTQLLAAHITEVMVRLCQILPTGVEVDQDPPDGQCPLELVRQAEALTRSRPAVGPYRLDISGVVVELLTILRDHHDWPANAGPTP